jgi:hypothetical protein
MNAIYANRQRLDKPEQIGTQNHIFLSAHSGGQSLFPNRGTNKIFGQAGVRNGSLNIKRQASWKDRVVFGVLGGCGGFCLTMN